MQLRRRRFLYLAAVATALPAWSRVVAALDYPTRPVRLVVGWPAGSGPDIPQRLIGQWLSERLGQQFNIDNRPGADGNIGTELAIKAAPDGYTLLGVVSTNAVNASFYTNLNFDFLRDIVPVGSIGRTPFVLLVNPSFAVKTVPELIAYARANPGKVNMASPGIGSTQHVCGELFKMMTGVDLVHVPYRGNYTTDLLNGQVQLAFMPMAQALQYVKDGTLRALAVTTATRSDALPGVAAIAEFVPGYVGGGWYGIGAPKDTPIEIVDILDTAISAGVADPTVKARFLALGIEPRPMTAAEFGNFIADESAKWAKVIKFAGIKAE
jgi:tripartite-type tricarboxylate transporter receptor subunit TctC